MQICKKFKRIFSIRCSTVRWTSEETKYQVPQDSMSVSLYILSRGVCIYGHILDIQNKLFWKGLFPK